MRDKQLNIELLTRWKLEAEFRKNYSDVEMGKSDGSRGT